MKLRKFMGVSAVLFCSAVIIVSCGGAGGGSSDSNSSASANSQMITEGNDDTVDEENEYPNEEQSIDSVSSTDIVSREDFLFRGISTLEIQVVIESLKYRRAYINICHQDKDGSLQYDNCLLNAPLKNGQITTDIVLANDVNGLGMTIWQYSPDDDPMEYSWTRSEIMLWAVEG